MKSKIISQEEFLSYMPHEDVLVYKFVGDRACLLGNFEFNMEGDSLLLNRYGTSGWEHGIKELEEDLALISCISDVQGYHAGDMYTFETDGKNIVETLKSHFGDKIVFYRTFTKEADFSFAKGLNLDEDTVLVCYYGSKVYSFPVYWQVRDRIEIEAATEEEAKSLLLSNIDDIPLGYSPNYVDGSYRLDEDGPVLVKGSFSKWYQHLSFRDIKEKEEK